MGEFLTLISMFNWRLLDQQMYDRFRGNLITESVYAQYLDDRQFIRKYMRMGDFWEQPLDRSRLQTILKLLWKI